ncbi:hypothetical protein [uncultured Aquimarina sp.]|uniref:hypothetical protein n=1 Tax=uncultured Aquimarina sp. TaxID=575652 RepID=UPI00262A4DEF|nr:hypothetical protein [uncultured Aquimarina sp.]
MFSTFNLKKLIQPHKKLSDFCSDFHSKILPYYELQILIDKTFEYSFSFQLPNCFLSIQVILKNDLFNNNKRSLSNPKIFVYTYVKGKYNVSRFSYDTTLDNLKSETYIRYLNNDSCYMEYHKHWMEIKNWNILDNSYDKSDRPYASKTHSVISPFNIAIEKNKDFLIMPSLIKYGGIRNNKSLKRYDFCFYVIFEESSLLTPDDIDSENFIYFEEIIIELANKTIRRRLIRNKIIYQKNLKFEMYNSTEKEELEFYKEMLYMGAKKISILYSIRAKKFEYIVSKKYLENFFNLFKMYETFDKNFQISRNSIR